MSKIFVDEIAGIVSADTVAIPGHVIQVVQGTDTSQDTITSTSYAASTLTASITPTSTSSKIVVFVSTTFQNSSGSTYNEVTVFRDGSVNIGGSNSLGISYAIDAFDVNQSSFSGIDTPNTTSTVQYTVYGKVQTNELRIGKAGLLSSIILMEIAG